MLPRDLKSPLSPLSPIPTSPAGSNAEGLKSPVSVSPLQDRTARPRESPEMTHVEHLNYRRKSAELVKEHAHAHAQALQDGKDRAGEIGTKGKCD